MKEIFLDGNFDVEDTTLKINNLMSKWSIHMLEINGKIWSVYDYENHCRFRLVFEVDFCDIETRINMEDLKLNVIHHIESLRDETTYSDNLISIKTLK